MRGTSLALLLFSICFAQDSESIKAAIHAKDTAALTAANIHKDNLLATKIDGELMLKRMVDEDCVACVVWMHKQLGTATFQHLDGQPFLTYAYSQTMEHHLISYLKLGAPVYANSKRYTDELIYKALVEDENGSLAKTLYQYGLDPNVVVHPKRKQTGLHLAASLNDVFLLELLINKGADLEARDKQGTTALLYAVAYGDNSEALAVLLNAGADYKNTEKYSLYEWAEKYDAKKCLRLLNERNLKPTY